MTHFFGIDDIEIVVGLKLFFNFRPVNIEGSQQHQPRVALKSFTFPSYKYFLRRILNILLVQLENRPTSRDRCLEPFGVSACEFKKGGFLHRENRQCFNVSMVPTQAWVDFCGCILGRIRSKLKNVSRTQHPVKI